MAMLGRDRIWNTHRSLHKNSRSNPTDDIECKRISLLNDQGLNRQVNAYCSHTLAETVPEERAATAVRDSYFIAKVSTEEKAGVIR